LNKKSLASVPAESTSLLRQQSLATQVRQDIEHMIESGELVAGDWINEAMIATRLNVSRGTVREGCRSLQESGLVHVIVNRGAFVREIDAIEAGELYALRAVLFGLAGKTLAPIITRPQLTALRKLLARMDKLAAAGDATGYYRENKIFHDLLFDYAGNRRLADQYQSYARELQLFLRKALMKPGRLIESNEEHREIVKYLEARDGASAAAMMERIVLEARNRVLGEY
jgi:DNA-binding GntR family transcriptional regulator